MKITQLLKLLPISSQMKRFSL